MSITIQLSRRFLKVRAACCLAMACRAVAWEARLSGARVLFNIRRAIAACDCRAARELLAVCHSGMVSLRIMPLELVIVALPGADGA